MKNLQDLRLFCEIARQGSLSACARKMDLSPAVVSASLKRLEADVGVLLFIRSTRSLRLTQKGQQFLLHCKDALAILDHATTEIHKEDLELSGVIQLSAPSDLGRNLLVPWLDEFMALHPKLAVRLQLSDSQADLYSQPVDLALRYGQPKDSALIAIPISANNLPVLCASPAYINEFGMPKTLDELAQHNCLCHGHNDTLDTRWSFCKGENISNIDVQGNRQCKDGDITRRWAIAGKGIARKSRLDIIMDLIHGRLIEINIDGWLGQPFPLNLVCAERRLLSPTVNAFKNHIYQSAKALTDQLESIARITR
ncbi:LysR family transcriptional regulator [Paraglaciecola sp. 20A4]|uniref:LysR family transcriptional regulator n=1 Tax=Paraglaciecola sp. 20A4 TaxID=2687288 RepID=UPI00140800CB|nr:LysR family transcriptional regulator [Paraglaciecola sp. 20A4]